jgi:hypothetical protein
MCGIPLMPGLHATLGVALAQRHEVIKIALGPGLTDAHLVVNVVERGLARAPSDLAGIDQRGDTHPLVLQDVEEVLTERNPFECRKGILDPEWSW